MSNRRFTILVIGLAVVAMLATGALFIWRAYRSSRQEPPLRIAPLPPVDRRPVGPATPPVEAPPPTQPEAEEILLYRVVQNGKFGFADRTGMIRIKPAYSQAGPFEDDYAPVQFNGRWGLIDLLGTLRIQPQYAQPPRFREGLAPVKGLDPERPGLLGYIDVDGAAVIAARFEDAGPFVGALAPAKSAGKWGFISLTGEWVISPRFDHAEAFSESLAAVWTDGLMGYIDRRGREAIGPRFAVGLADAAWTRFADGRAAVVQDGKWGYVDSHGTLIVGASFDAARPFSEGLAAVQQAGQWGFVNEFGKLVIPARYRAVGQWVGPRGASAGLCEGLAAVATRDESTWGYLDRNGRMVISPQLRQAGPFRAGRAEVATDAGVALIDKTGQFIRPPSR